MGPGLALARKASRSEHSAYKPKALACPAKLGCHKRRLVRFANTPKGKAPWALAVGEVCKARFRLVASLLRLAVWSRRRMDEFF